MRRHVLPWAGPQLATGILVLPFLLSGCMDARFGADLPAKPKTQPIGRLEGKTWRLPQDAPFAIAVPQVTRKPGLDGTAEADAKAEPAGTAEASASVKNTGAAEGLFQLGHALTNDRDEQVDLDFTVRLHYEFAAQAEPEIDIPDAIVGLMLYARDNHGKLVRDLTLVRHSSDAGATQQQGDKTVNFTVTLGPGDSVNVFVAGQAKVDIREGRSGSGSLKLSGLQMDVVARPAPAVRTASDGQK